MAGDTKIELSGSSSTVLAVAVLVLAGIGGFLLLGGGDQSTAATGNAAGTAAANGGTTDVVRKTVDIVNSQYQPGTITVEKGQTVVVTVRNQDGVGHGITLSRFGVDTGVRPGGMTTFRFTADSTGSYQTFCSSSHPEHLNIRIQA